MPARTAVARLEQPPQSLPAESVELGTHTLPVQAKGIVDVPRVENRPVESEQAPPPYQTQVREAPPKILSMDDAQAWAPTAGEQAISQADIQTSFTNQLLASKTSNEQLKMVQNASWDRFNASIDQLSDPAKDAFKNVLTLVVSDFAKDEGRVKDFKGATPEKQAENKDRWTAQAAQKFGEKPVDCLVANGHFEMIDPSLTKNMADGARQFLEASDKLEVQDSIGRAAPLASRGAEVEPSRAAIGRLGGILGSLGSFFGFVGAEKSDSANKTAYVAKTLDLSKPLKTVEMDSHYRGENEPDNSVWSGKSVKYLNDEERAEYRLEIRDGKLYDHKGRPFDTDSAKSVHSGGGQAIFVMTENGEFYASLTQKVGQFHHSSLYAGQPVAAAGELSVKNGVITMISNRSGHYRPPSSHTDQALDVLHTKGVDVSGVKKEGF